MIQSVSNVIEKNGKTIKENNLELKHNISIGTLVEVKYDEWYGDGACEKVHARLFIVAHGRDCDGTPLYSLCHHKTISQYNKISIKIGFTESDLKIIEQTNNVKKGKFVLEWK
ncbi:unnamed protein product [marine sediment metagenome]|uniref:Uncharacterized protein n=1 Tax=marine sediment metagenome TaxID=412755 RepID=X0UAY8_9ZZZZ